MMFNLRRSKREERVKTKTSIASGNHVLNGAVKVKTTKKSCLRKPTDLSSSVSSSSRSSCSMGSSSKFSLASSLDDEPSTSTCVTLSSTRRNPVEESIESSSSRPLSTNSRDISGNRILSKTVRFNEVHIRDYERDIGDNPSCSNGPPVGIGWAHGETDVVDVNVYERRRHGRREQSEMILTRHERENLLSSWGVQPDVVARAIRANYKIKNQRRQTVRNLSKATIEENLEKAKRKLKNAVRMGRRTTNEEFGKLQRQAYVAAKDLAKVDQEELSAALAEKEDDGVTAAAAAAPILEAHTGNDRVPVSNDSRNQLLVSISEDEKDTVDYDFDVDDSSSLMSGLTRSNSTTASMKEIEDFYRELESDLFGSERSSPYMVGQTIECATHDASTYASDSLPLVDWHPNGHQEQLIPVMMINNDVSGGENLSRDPHQSTISSDYGQTLTPHHRSNIPQNHLLHHGHNESGFPVGNPWNRQTYAMDDIRLATGWQTNRPLDAGNNYPLKETRQEWFGYSDDQQRVASSHRKNCDNHQKEDGPRVYHMPLPSYTSPTQWMEGVEREDPTNDHYWLRNVHCFEAITITEAALDAPNHHVHHQPDFIDRY